MPKRALILALSLPILVGSFACGGDGGNQADEPATVTETVERTTTEEAPSEPAGAGSGGGGGGGRITVPDVVGKDHQLAQDTLQAAGLYSLDEEDATGQGRLLLFDRNWTAVRQKPAAGERVSSSETITLYSKKDGE